MAKSGQRGRRTLGGLLGVVVVSHPLVAGANDVDTTSSVAVMGLETPADFPGELRAALSAAIAQTLDDLRAFSAISDTEVRAIVEQGKIAAILREAEPDFEQLAALGARLEADYLIIGSVVYDASTRTGESNLQLLRVRPPAPVDRVSRPFEGAPEIVLSEVRALTRLLVRDLLARYQGRLRVLASEEGATVSVNDRIVGSTPLTRTLDLAEGYNMVEIEKEGFVYYRRDVEIVRDQLTEISATLVPSEAYIEQYQRRIARRKVLGWSLVGIGVLAAGGAALAYAEGARLTDDLNRDIDAYNAQPNILQTPSQFDALRDRDAEIGTLDVVAVVALSASIVSAVAGTWVLIATDDPRRYDGRASVGSTSRRWKLSPGLAQLTVRLDF